MGSGALGDPEPLAEAAEWALKCFGPDFRPRAPGWEHRPLDPAFLLFSGAAKSRGFPLRVVAKRGQEEGCLKCSGYCPIGSGHLKR